MGWLIYALVVLVCSGIIGMHLGRFREAYTEMTGMMAGMTMGMLNGLVLGYAGAALTVSMFWGNLFGILLGLVLGSYFGRAGGLMGVMDGAMGGVMGGSMGAMLAIMVRYPEEGLTWTAVLLGVIYVAGMLGLVVLIERSAPEHAALHRLAPMFARAVAHEATAVQAAERYATGQGPVNYYELLDIPVKATQDDIMDAYAAYIAETDAHGAALAEEALATLTNPQARVRYDRALAVASGRDACCPPPRRSAPAAAGAGSPVAAAAAAASGTALPKRLVDYYAVLGVPPDATEDEILEAYEGPVADEDDAATARAERAFTVLSDPDQRASYDRALTANRAARATAARPGPATERPPVGIGAEPRNQPTAGRGAPEPGVRPPLAARNGNGQAAPGQQAIAAAASAGDDPRKGGPPAGPANGHGPAPAAASNGAATITVRPVRTTPPQRGSGAKNGAPRTTARAVHQQDPPRNSGLVIFGVVGAILLVIAFMLFTSRPGSAGGTGSTGFASGSSGQTDAQALARAVPATIGADGVQTVNVLLNGDTFQYEPPVIKLKKGIPARFNLSVKGEPG